MIRKRKRSAIKQQDSYEIPEKRKKIYTTTDTESTPDRSLAKKKKQKSPKSTQKKDKSSRNVIEKVGGFFKKLKNNLSEQSKKLKSKFSRKRKWLPKTQSTTAGVFTITNCRREQVIENINGFKVVHSYQDVKNEPM